MAPFCEPSTFSTSDRSRVLEPTMPFIDMYCEISGGHEFRGRTVSELVSSRLATSEPSGRVRQIK